MCRCSTNHINFVRVYLNMIIRYIQLIQPLALKNLPNPKPFLLLTQTSLPTRPKKLHGISQRGNPTPTTRLNGALPKYPKISPRYKKMQPQTTVTQYQLSQTNLTITSLWSTRQPSSSLLSTRMTLLSFYTLKHFILSNNTC